MFRARETWRCRSNIIEDFCARYEKERINTRREEEGEEKEIEKRDSNRRR